MSFLQSIVCMKSASDYAASNCNTRTNVKICHFCVQNLKLHWLQKPAFCPAVDYLVNKHDISVCYVDTELFGILVGDTQSFHCHAHFVSTSQSWTMSFRFSWCSVGANVFTRGAINHCKTLCKSHSFLCLKIYVNLITSDCIDIEANAANIPFTQNNDNWTCAGKSD